MGAAPDGHAPARPVHHLLDALDELGDVAEARGAVGVGEERVLAPNVAQSVRDAAALAPVSDEGHDAKDVVQPVVAGKVQHHVDGAVAAAVVDNEDLVAAGRVGARGRGASAAAPVGADGSPGLGGAADVLVEVGDSLAERGEDALLLVVGREDDAQEHLCGLDGADVGRGQRVLVGRDALLVQAALGEPAVVPAGQRRGRRGRARGAGRDVRLLRREGWSGPGGDEMEEAQELQATSVTRRGTRRQRGRARTPTRPRAPRPSRQSSKTWAGVAWTHADSGRARRGTMSQVRRAMASADGMPRAGSYAPADQKQGVGWRGRIEGG